MKPHHNENYLKWVRSLPCIMCGAPESELRQAVGLAGVSGNVGAQYSIPYCNKCHERIAVNNSVDKVQYDHYYKITASAIWEFGADSHIGQVLSESRRRVRSLEPL